jgi:phosphoglycerate dehydrogenase-like enzyme
MDDAAGDRLAHALLNLEPADMQRMEGRMARAGIAIRWLTTADSLGAELGEVRFLLTGAPPRIDWSPARQLRLLQVAGVGVDPLFPAEGLADSVHIANLRGSNSDAVRDHVLAMMLALARDLPRLFGQRLVSEWDPFPSEPVRGKTVMLLGLGAIGTAIADACRALGMRVHATRRHAERRAASVDRLFGAEELGTSFTDADFLVVCLPLTPETRGLLGPALLEALPPRASLINVSRGGIVDEVRLESMLRAGRLRGAALDVFEREPLPPESTLWSCPRLIITPHQAGWTTDYLDRVGDIFVENIERVTSGRPPTTAVSRTLGY